jgi:dTDP-4-dehydrorhamnose reductase
MNIIITGGSGLLGQYLNIELSKFHKIMTLYNNNIGNCNLYSSVKIDLKDYKKLGDIFADFKPQCVIHTAAISNVLKTKSIDSKVIYKTNVFATKNLAELCEKYSAKLIFTSTDLVYAGYRGSMLKENSKLIPLSLYAETKLMGEVKIQETFDNYIILRTALLYGFGLNHSTNHFQKTYYDLKNGNKVNLFTDQFRTPLSLPEAARIISELIKLDVKSEILNFGGLERVSRYELGEKLCEVAKFDKNLLNKIKMDDVPDLPKVEDVSMNTDRLAGLGIKRKTIDESIKEIIK